MRVAFCRTCCEQSIIWEAMAASAVCPDASPCRAVLVCLPARPTAAAAAALPDRLRPPPEPREPSPESSLLNRLRIDCGSGPD